MKLFQRKRRFKKGFSSTFALILGLLALISLPLSFKLSSEIRKAKQPEMMPVDEGGDDVYPSPSPSPSPSSSECSKQENEPCTQDSDCCGGLVCKTTPYGKNCGYTACDVEGEKR